MKQIKSQALGLVNRALGLFGEGAARTEFPDGELIQQIDVAPLIRRGNVLGQTGGIFTFILQNDHPSGGDLSTSIEPYNLGNVGLLPPFPAHVPAQFDLYLLGASVRQVGGDDAGASNANVAVNNDLAYGFGIDNSGVAVGGTPADQLIAYWDQIRTSGGVKFFTNSNNSGTPEIQLRRRIPRQGTSTIVFRSTVSADAVLECYLLIGLFPVGLGQDALV